MAIFKTLHLEKFNLTEIRVTGKFMNLYTVAYVRTDLSTLSFSSFPSKKYHFQASLKSKQEVFQIEIGNPKIVQIFLKRTSQMLLFFPLCTKEYPAKQKARLLDTSHFLQNLIPISGIIFKRAPSFKVYGITHSVANYLENWKFNSNQ